MQLAKIINARNVILNFADRNDIEFHLTYLMSKFIAKTEKEYAFYINETNKLFKKYGEEQDENKIIIPDCNKIAFNEAIAKLESTDVEDPEIKFNLTELASELKLSMKQIYPLLDFIDEEK